MRGGPSNESEVSLKTGASILKNLSDRYAKKDIFIAKDGTWHMNGVPTTIDRVGASVDVVINALHGEYGEDGKVQRILDDHQIPYTGSDAHASLLGFQKHHTKEIFNRAGLKTPRHLIFRADAHEDPHAFALKLHRSFAPPWIIKPVASGSSVGVSLAKTVHDVPYALEKALFHSPVAMAEEFIRGREATCGVVDDFRGKEHYALFPVEIVHTKPFFDYDSKYGGEVKELCPSTFNAEQKSAIEAAAVAVHKAVGARHYSRTDMMVTPRGVYVLEINTLPGMTEHSLLPKSLAAIGCTLPQFLDHLIAQALK